MTRDERTEEDIAVLADDPWLTEVMSRAPQPSPEQCARIAELLRPDSRLRRAMDEDRAQSDVDAS